MKNKYRFLQLLIMTLLFFGCETENVTTSEIEENTTAVEPTKAAYDFKVAVKNDMLSFATRDDFDKAIEHVGGLGDENFATWENEISFKSMRSVFTENELDEKGISDYLLAVFLNPEGMISFGENTFKINYVTNEVIMVTNQDFSAKSNFAGKSKRIFNADDDIFGLLDGSVTESENLSARRGCKQDRSQKKNVYVGQDKYEIKAVYQRWWPFYSLQAKIKRADRESVAADTWIYLETVSPTFFRKKRKKDCNFKYPLSAGGYGRAYNLRIYYGSRQLQAYDFVVRFSGSNINGQLNDLLNPQCRPTIYCRNR